MKKELQLGVLISIILIGILVYQIGTIQERKMFCNEQRLGLVYDVRFSLEEDKEGNTIIRCYDIFDYEEVNHPDHAGVYGNVLFEYQGR